MLTLIYVFFVVTSIEPSRCLDQFYNISSKTWDNEYKKGKWAHLNSAVIERSRNTVIAVLYNLHKTNGTILDVGCGN